MNDSFKSDHILVNTRATSIFLTYTLTFFMTFKKENQPCRADELNFWGAVVANS